MINDIPDEIIYKIFEFCDIQMIYNLTLSRRKFYAMIKNDYIWEYLLKRDFDTKDIKLALSLSPSLEDTSNEDTSNKNIYKKCLKIYNLSGYDRCCPDIMNINVSLIDVRDINQNKIINDTDKDKYAKINRDNLTFLNNDVDGDTPIQIINFDAIGYINKILLLDFPKTCNYKLVLNGQDITIANYNNDIAMYQFTFDKNKDGAFICNNIPCFEFSQNTVGTFVDIDDKIYLNFDKIDSSKIILIPKIKLRNKHHIRLSGKFKQNNVWIEGFYDTVIYAPYNNLSVFINNPTDSLDIKSNSDHGNIILLMNGYKYGTFKSSTKMMRIKFYDENLQTIGRQNEYLSDEINKTTINMSKIDSLRLIQSNCKIIELYQNYYNIYNRVDDTLVFSN